MYEVEHSLVIFLCDLVPSTNIRWSFCICVIHVCWILCLFNCSYKVKVDNCEPLVVLENHDICIMDISMNIPSSVQQFWLVRYLIEKRRREQFLVFTELLVHQKLLCDHHEPTTTDLFKPSYSWSTLQICKVLMGLK